MSRARIVALLREFFTNREMEVEEGDSVDLTVRDANNILGIKIIISPFTRDEVERLLVSEELDEYDKVYVAVPSRYVTLLPPLDVLRAAGIGVLEVSAEGVVERVAAPPRRGRRSNSNAIPEDVVAEIRSLRVEVERLGEELRRLRREVSRIRDLEERVRRLEASRAVPRRMVAAAEIKTGEEAASEKSVSGVPSFAVDNPWLGLLSKRGGR